MIHEQPVIRYMFLCDDVLEIPGDPDAIHIVGRRHRIRPESDALPIRVPQLCAVITFSNARGRGTGELFAVDAETGRRVWGYPPKGMQFPSDPLAICAVSFRVVDCHFPRPGVYAIEFWYNGEKLAEQPITVESYQP